MAQNKIGAKYQRQRVAQNSGGEDQEYESNSSNYNEENFENEDDPLREDVSSEGSCLKSNSYQARSSSRKGELDEFNIIGQLSPDAQHRGQVEINPYEHHDEDENFNIPDEEEQYSPRKVAA